MGTIPQTKPQTMDQYIFCFIVDLMEKRKQQYTIHQHINKPGTVSLYKLSLQTFLCYLQNYTIWLEYPSNKHKGNAMYSFSRSNSKSCGILEQMITQTASHSNSFEKLLNITFLLVILLQYKHTLAKQTISIISQSIRVFVIYLCQLSEIICTHAFWTYTGKIFAR